MAKKNLRKRKKALKKRILKQIRDINPRYKVRLTKLDNSSRSGFYIYVKDKRTKRERGYKFRPEYDEGYYIELYKNKLKKKKSDVRKRGKERLEKYRKELKTRTKIEEVMSKGKTEVNIQGKHIDRALIKKAYMQMLAPVVKDKKIIEILTLQENIEKVRNRIEMIIEVEGTDGEYIKLNKVGCTIESVKDFLERFSNLTDLNKTDIDKAKSLGFNIDNYANIDLGKYDKPYIKKRKSTKIKLIFRKGR